MGHPSLLVTAETKGKCRSKSKSNGKSKAVRGRALVPHTCQKKAYVGHPDFDSRLGGRGFRIPLRSGREEKVEGVGDDGDFGGDGAEDFAIGLDAQGIGVRAA